MARATTSGPLKGIRIIELAGLGALPFGSLKLADMGADIVRIDRATEVPDPPVPRPRSTWDRGRRSIGVDLKSPAGVECVLRLAERADAFLESFRPGVAERLGVGPDDVLARNPRVVYGRLTGWGQSGPLALSAGHSLNYESITGVIRAIGPTGGPPIPLLQILGDFAGGGLLMAYGVVCALLEAQRSGKGQVVDAAMVDGTISLMGPYYGMAESGFMSDNVGTNLFDGGAHYYNVYETKDGKFVSVAPIEPHFYKLLLEALGLPEAHVPEQNDRSAWAEMKQRFAAAFKTKTRDEWCELLEGTDACFAPVLSVTEARSHPHNVARETFVDGTSEINVFPRLSRTPGDPRTPSPSYIGADTEDVLVEFGFEPHEIAALRSAGAVR